jgi:non-specific protein-tyrosine kinase
MELKQYWNLILKWKWLIVIGVLLAGGTAFLISRSMTPMYQATTRLLVTPGSPQVSESYSSVVASERLALTYAQLLKSKPLVEETYRRLNGMQMAGERASGPGADSSFPLPLSLIRPWVEWGLNWLGLSDVGDSAATPQIPDLYVSAEPIRDTQLINLRAEGTDPVWITEAINTLVEVFIEWQKGVQQSRYSESKANLLSGMERVQADIEETESRFQALEALGDMADRNELSRLQDQLAQYRNNYAALLNSYSNIDLAEANSGATVTVVSPAVVPTAPVRPRVMMNTLLAAVLGGLAAVGIAFLIEYLDDTVKTQDDLRTADLNLLAAVQRAPRNRGNGDDELYAMSQPNSLISESYRTLRTNLQFSSLDKPLRSLVVTSALAAEGKTTTAANLAVVLAQDGKRVVLVDADLRRPNIHKLLGLPNRAGLTIALVDDPVALGGYIRDTEVENLRVLTAGPVPPNPQEMLGSKRMADLLDKLKESADIVIVDTPPALAVADANVLATRTDGVLLIVNTGHTRRGAIQQAVDGLRKVGSNLVGGVLNMVPTRKGGGYYYQYHYYYSDYRQDADTSSRRRRTGNTSRRGGRTRSPDVQPEPAKSRG